MYSEYIKRKLEIRRNASRHLAWHVRLINTAYYQTENGPMCKDRIINMDIFVTCAGYFCLSLNVCVCVCVHLTCIHVCGTQKMVLRSPGAEATWNHEPPNVGARH